MTAIVETSTYTGTITQIETADLVLGGVGGPSNRALVELANRTKWLYDRISSLTELPVAALPYPTIATSDNRLTVTRAAATAGGKVIVASGTLLTLAEVVVSAATGRLRTFTTAAYTSSDLQVSSTYYLRGQVDGSGNLLVYTQRGTDSDSIPAGLLGTPDASSGGGFDSTVFDILLAKVVTGVAGSLPTFTALANAHRLIASQIVTGGALVGEATNGSYSDFALSLNWARTPQSQIARSSYYRSESVMVDGVADYDSIFSSLATTRYSISGRAQIDFLHFTPPTIAILAIA